MKVSVSAIGRKVAKIIAEKNPQLGKYVETIFYDKDAIYAATGGYKEKYDDKLYIFYPPENKSYYPCIHLRLMLQEEQAVRLELLYQPYDERRNGTEFRNHYYKGTLPYKDQEKHLEAIQNHLSSFEYKNEWVAQPLKYKNNEDPEGKRHHRFQHSDLFPLSSKGTLPVDDLNKLADLVIKHSMALKPAFNIYKPHFNRRANNEWDKFMTDNSIDPNSGVNTFVSVKSISAKVEDEKRDYNSDEFLNPIGIPEKSETVLVKRDNWINNPVDNDETVSLLSPKKDYIEEAKRNAAFGERAEQFVMNYERNRLAKLNINKEVVQVSKQSDGYGYDILSWDSEETERYIEVKSVSVKSRKGRFFLSNREFLKGRKLSNYYIYLVFEVENGNPEIIELKEPFHQNSDFQNKLEKEVEIYKITFELNRIMKKN